MPRVQTAFFLRKGCQCARTALATPDFVLVPFSSRNCPVLSLKLQQYLYLSGNRSGQSSLLLHPFPLLSVIDAADMHASSSSSGRGMPMPPPPPLPPTPHHHHHHFYHHHHQRHPEFRHATGVSTPAAAAATAAAAAAAAHAAAVNAATATDSGTAWDSDNVAYVGMEYSNTGACSQRARAPSLRRPGSSAGGCSQTKAAFSSLYSDERGLGETPPLGIYECFVLLWCLCSLCTHLWLSFNFGGEP